MDYFEDIRQKKIYNIICIVKLVSLLLSSVIIYNQFFTQNNIVFATKDGYFNEVAIALFTFVIALIYWIWSFFSIRIFESKHVKKIQMIENGVFILIFSSLIILSHTCVAQYKFLFLFIIITSTLQLGKKYGIIMSVISSIIILLIDLTCFPYEGINARFENDLILVGVFILTAWPLGHYVKIENENIEYKNLQLKELNSRLTKEDKRRKYMEDILLKNETCYNLLIKNSMDAIFVHRDGRLIFANESAANLLGFNDVDKLNGKWFSDFVPEEEKKVVGEKFEQIYDEKTTMSLFEEKIIKNNGQMAIMQNTSTYFIYEEQPTILSILHDITSEKQVEKLQKDVEKNIELLNETREVNKLITEFLSNISHELKTPLNVIYSAVQLLGLYNKSNKDTQSVEKQDKYLNVMKQNCYRLMRLINNLLDMTKLDSGFLKLNLSNYDIVSVIEDITLSVASYVESKGLNLTFDTDVEEKIMAFDGDKIERITLNLLSNAIKFTNSGGNIYVTVKDMGEYVTISVKDTGIGIPKDKLRLIFERFGQVNKTFRRDREGSGIGLYLVKSFVEMHGGEIYIKSELGQGSEFVLKLPAKSLEESEEHKNSLYETSTESINMEFSDI
ncbi:MASE3 domain-containing sensor histidine kinase [Clostridium rectalis]|uniref:PAS domain-containing sensor histidine kinase n=1 Tax=Clostridium rectalis TaxID=2040295 RepID=UPI003C12C6A1